MKNDKREIGKWTQKLKRTDYQGKIVMESTGRYHLVLAMVLKESGLDARVINPLLSKKYASSSVYKVKTDKRDSEMLSCVALLEEKLPDAFQLQKSDVFLKKKISLIAMLDKEIQKIKASLNEFASVSQDPGFKPSVCERKIMKIVAGLEKEKKELEKEIERIVKENRNEEMDRYATVPGISSYASSVFSLFFSPRHSLSPKQWIAFAGLDVSVRESGHWKGKGKLTKRGNGYLRKRLYQAAWGGQ